MDRTGASVDCFPVHPAFPDVPAGRHPYLHFRGLLRLYSRYGPLDRSTAQRRPLSRGFSPASRPARPLVSYQINRQLSGWNLPPLVKRAFGTHRTNREQFLDRNGNPRYDCKNVGRAVPRRGGGLERRGDGTERKLRSAALNALTTFPRGQSARVPARPAGKPRRRRMFSACRPRAVRLHGRVAVATDPPWRHYGVHTSQIRDGFHGTARGGGFPLLREAGKVAEGRMGCGKQVWSDEGSR